MSLASSVSDAASSLNPKSIIHTSPSAATNTFASRRSRCASRRRRSTRICSQMATSNSSVTASASTRSSDLPSIASYDSTNADGSADASATNARRAHAEVACREREQRFVFDRAAQRRVATLVAEVARQDLAVHPEEEVGAAFVATQCLHEQRAPVDGAGEVWSRAACVETRLLDARERFTDCRHAVCDAGRARPARGCAQQHEHERAREPADEQGPDRRQVDRRARARATTASRSRARLRDDGTGASPTAPSRSRWPSSPRAATPSRSWRRRRRRATRRSRRLRPLTARRPR